MARLVLLSSAVAAASAASYTPAFFWSEKLDAGLGRDAQHLKEVSGAAIEHTMAAIANSPAESTIESLLQNAPESAQPEVQLVFMLADLDTDAIRQHGSAFANVQRLMQTSASSLTVPFTSRVEADAPSMFRTATRVAGNKAEDYLAAHPELFSNKAADLIVIELSPIQSSMAEALQAQDAFVGRISGIASKASGGNYAALLTGKGTHPQAARRQLQEDAKPKLRITKNLLTALLVSFVLIVIFMAGFCCLFSLQTPRKFEDVRKDANHQN